MRLHLLILVISILSVNRAAAQFDLSKFLIAFQTNPKAVLASLPVKDNAPISLSEIDQKIMVRRAIVEEKENSKSIILPNDYPQVIVGSGPVESNLRSMHEQKLLQSSPLKVSPWSDDYWPIYKGVLGNRYADESFSSFFEWKFAWQYTRDNSVVPILERHDSAEVDQLSLSEKYDLVFGLGDLGQLSL